MLAFKMILGEYTSHMLLPSVNKANHSGFESPKQGCQWPPRKGLCVLQKKILYKKKKKCKMIETEELFLQIAVFVNSSV